MSRHRYEEITGDIRIAVEPDFLDDQSQPDECRYLWTYRVTIENRGSAAVQLLSRHWRITDGRGKVREVRGDGVVGEQPVIGPGGSFQYTSGAPLETACGFMTGTYQMRDAAGKLFDVNIPMFALESPYERQSVQ
ncbi:MAG TPA: Co2+/Mg2+ efflux protein ApaG [Micropepsaceae bacterium]|nr:Co2+/Mg2+ efflux protein ApaG [Micropepsaceae bacterium]